MLKLIKPITVLWLFFALVPSTFVAAQSPCHPQCSWQCDNPVCPAICLPVCAETLCQEPVCDNADCTCASFGPLTTTNCAPLENDCPLCDVGRQGIDCVDGQNQACSCTASCQTRDCELECVKPACPKPKCELICEEALCQEPDSSSEVRAR